MVYCEYCKKPISQGRYIKAEQGIFHEKCYHNHVALKCSLCGKSISGRYSKDYWGNTYCDNHTKQYAPCFYCQRLISDKTTRGGIKYGDGRTICAICAKTAVNNDNQAAAILQKARIALEKYGITLGQYNPRLFLVDRKKLKSLSKQSREQSGFTYFKMATRAGQIESLTIDIYILKGLPEVSFLATAAHELMHVWHHLNGIPGTQAAYLEGSCNYAAYLVLALIKSPESLFEIHKLMKNPDKVYGDGFRKVKNLADKKGRPFWLSHLRKNKKLPFLVF